LLCIAGDFTKYDEYACCQIPRNIELLRYRRYGGDLLLLELVRASTTFSLDGVLRRARRLRKNRLPPLPLTLAPR